MKCGGSRSGVQALGLDSANVAGNPVVSGSAKCRNACGQAHAGLRVRGLQCFVTGLALLLGLVAHAPLPAGIATLATIECKVDGRMVDLPGGDRPADHEDHPWQVAIQLDGSYFGGGVLLDAGWVLTTGHQVADAIATRMAVVYGEVDPRDFERAERDAVEGNPQVNGDGASRRGTAESPAEFRTVRSDHARQPCGRGPLVVHTRDVCSLKQKESPRSKAHECRSQEHIPSSVSRES